jgi:biotin carboxyl carrier protein
VQYEVEIGGRIRHVVVHRVQSEHQTASAFVVAIDGVERVVDAVPIDPETWSFLIEGRSHEVTVVPQGHSGDSLASVGQVPIVVSLNGRRRSGRKEDGAEAGAGAQRVLILAPMPGKVVRVLAKVGDAVQARQAVVVIEAMKMENELRAARDGVVAEMHAAEGQSVDAGALLAVIA